MATNKTRPPVEAAIIQAAVGTGALGGNRLSAPWVRYFIKQHQSDATLLTPAEIEAVLMTSRSH